MCHTRPHVLAGVRPHHQVKVISPAAPPVLPRRRTRRQPSGIRSTHRLCRTGPLPVRNPLQLRSVPHGAVMKYQSIFRHNSLRLNRTAPGWPTTFQPCGHAAAHHIHISETPSGRQSGRPAGTAIGATDDGNGPFQILARSVPVRVCITHRCYGHTHHNNPGGEHNRQQQQC